MPDVTQLSSDQFHGWALGRVVGAGADGIVYEAEKAGVERAIRIFLPETAHPERMQP